MGVSVLDTEPFRKPSPQHSKGKGDSSSARHSARLSSTLSLTIDREIDAAAVGQQSSLHGFIECKHVRMVMLSDYDCISKSVYNFGRYSVKRHKRTLRSHVISYTDRYIYVSYSSLHQINHATVHGIVTTTLASTPQTHLSADPPSLDSPQPFA